MYPGGDSNMAKHILKVAPKHSTYCEPFVGGGAVFWRHPGAKKFVLADADPEVLRVYKALRTGSLEKEIKAKGCILSTKALFDRLGKKKKRTPLETIYRWRAGFYSRNNCYNINLKKKQCFEKLVRLMGNLRAKAKMAEIYKADYADTIKYADSPDTFFYLDPPWQGSATYKDPFYKHNSLSFKKLMKAIKGIKGKFLMYHSFEQELADLFKKEGFHTYFVKKRGSGATYMGDGKKGYLFVSNYSIPRKKWTTS